MCRVLGTGRRAAWALAATSTLWLSAPIALAQDAVPAETDDESETLDPAAEPEGDGPEALVEPDAQVESRKPRPPSTQEAVGSAEVDTLRRQLQEATKRMDDQQARLDLLEAAEVERAEASAYALEDPAETGIRLYGFSDVGVRRFFADDDNPRIAFWPPATTFVLGSLNIYFDAIPAQDFRALSEVRFTNYPNGTPTANSIQGQSTEVYDVGSASGGANKVRWSGIVLERAWLEWNRFDALSVRAGYFFVPYGIWNVDHGMPTTIANQLPQFISHEVFPSRQLGIQLLGNFAMDSWDVGYRLWAGNGRTEEELDETDDKMVGGRVFVTRNGDLRVTAGASGFYGKNTWVDGTVSSAAPLTTAREETVAFTEYGGSADLSVDWDALRFRAEMVVARQVYDDDLRFPLGPGVYRPDRTRAGSYALLAYRLPVWNLEPYFYTEYSQAGGNEAARINSGGLNIHFAPSVLLKTQFAHVAYEPPGDDANFSVIDTRFVMAF